MGSRAEADNHRFAATPRQNAGGEPERPAGAAEALLARPHNGLGAALGASGRAVAT